MFKPIATLSVAAILAGSVAHAATEASATTDLNLRAGPSPQSEIIGVIPNEGSVTVQVCAVNSEWCEVSFDGQTGWAYGSYLTTPMEGETVTVYQNREALQIETVERDGSKGEGAVVGGTVLGSLAAAAIGGPVAIAAGVATGAAAGAASQPGDEVVTYIRENPAEPVYLNGEVVVGAGVPQEVTLQPIPQAKYTYATINGVPVVIDPETRVVVEVVR